ncbi:MAG TPA: hypothetical protein VMB81_04210 [Candidatus Sulfotelmatobacter sp.]|nr:hypothetical protein [Candidatus Sulfotelmatobacter sp.]
MFGLPRDASHAHKLAIMLHHLGFDRDAADARLLDDVCAALLDHLACRARVGLPVRMINDKPLLEPGLRDAAFVLGALLDRPRMARFAPPDVLEGYAFRTAEWLRPLLETHGYRWPWTGTENRQVA